MFQAKLQDPVLWVVRPCNATGSYNASKKHAASVFRAENRDSAFLRNAGNHQKDSSVSTPPRRQHELSPPSKPQISIKQPMHGAGARYGGFLQATV